MILEATIGSTVYKLGVLQDSYSFDERCGDAGRHSTSSVSLNVRPFDLEGKNFGAVLFQADGLVPAVLKNGTDTVFTGYVRPFVSTSAKNLYSENISLEVMDPTESMHIYVWPSTETDPSRLKEQVWQNTNLKAIMIALFSSVGKTCDTSALPNESIPWIRTAEGDYINDVIDEILFEYGYDYKWTPTGTATFFPTFVPSASMDSITDIRNTLATSRSDDTTEGVKVTYGKYSEYSGLLYDDSQYYFTIFEDIVEGKYYNGVMHDSYRNSWGKDSVTSPTTNSWDFEKIGLKDENKKTITTSDVFFVEIDPSTQVKVWIDNESGVDFTPHLENVSATGFRFWVDYKGLFDFRWTWHTEIYGKIGYRASSERKYRVTGANPEIIDLKYRLSVNDNEAYDSIKSFAEAYAERQKASKVNYAFDSLADYTVGDFYHLSDPVGGRSQVVRVTSKSVDKDGIRHYKCEGASTVDVIQVIESVESAGVTLPPKTVYQYALENGFTGTASDLYSVIVQARPKCLGYVSEIPTSSTVFDKAPIVGDTCIYYVAASGSSSEIQRPYVYDGTDWHEVTNATFNELSYEQWSGIGQTVIVNRKGVNDTSSAIYAYFQYLYAQKALIEELQTNEIKSSNFEFGSTNKVWWGISWDSTGGNVSILFSMLRMQNGGPKDVQYDGTIVANGTTIGSGTYSFSDDFNSCKFTAQNGSTIEFFIFGYKSGTWRNGVSVNGSSISAISSASVNAYVIRDLAVPIAKALIPWDMKYTYSDPTYIGSSGTPFDYGYFGKLYADYLELNPHSSAFPNFKRTDEGTVQLPNGMIMKWKNLPPSNSGTYEWRTWTFEDPFPNACVWAFSSMVGTTASRDNYFYGYVTESSRTFARFSSWGNYYHMAIAIGY